RDVMPIAATTVKKIASDVAEGDMLLEIAAAVRARIAAGVSWGMAMAQGNELVNATTIVRMTAPVSVRPTPVVTWVASGPEKIKAAKEI
ncbi:MAG: hypothetical protein ACM3S0_12145, partial [Acidobacteriota bacterium]